MTHETHNLKAVRHVVGIAAGKGGVGKSTLALNLALTFASKGFKVGLMDADLYGPSLRKMLPEEILPAEHEEIQNRILPAMSRGIKLISMSYFLQEGHPASVRAPIANGIIKQFIHQVEWGELDFLFVDFPPGTGDIQLTLIQEGSFSGAVIVTTPQEIALLDVAKTVEMFHQMQVSLVGLVENMSHYEVEKGNFLYPFGQGGGERFAQEKGIFFLGRVPLDPEVSRCADQGISLIVPGSLNPAAMAFQSIADRIREQLESFEKLEANHLNSFNLKWK